MSEQRPLTPSQIYSRAYYKTNKEAHKEKMRAYYEAHKEAAKERQRAWKAANKDYEKDKIQAWYEDNPEYRREYYEANKDSIKEQMRAWHEANPEALRNKKAKRKGAPGEITPGWIPKLLELQRWTCVVCNKDLRYGYHIDHITPIARGGENIDYNLQALCPTCNLQKSDKDPIDFMQSRGFLL